MPTFTLRTPMPVSAEELYEWHARPSAFLRLVPPWETVQITEKSGTFGDNYRLKFRTPMFGPIHTVWDAEAFDFQPGRQFRDRQLYGPFAFWEHTHRMIPDGPHASFLEDHIEYRLPLGPVGALFGSGLVNRRLTRMFAYRHAVTASDLRRHAAFRDRPRLRIAITGSRGLVGSELCLFLVAGGHSVVRLVRGPADPNPAVDGTTSITWNPEAEVDPAIFENVDAVIHLAGDNVAEGRWNAAKIARIRDSRLGPTRRLAEAAAKAGHPRVFASASAVGFYGDRGDEILDETSSPGTGFFPELAQIWEAATEPAKNAGLRVPFLRIGVVLSPKAGALGKQLFAFRMGVGAVLGSGKQWVSWITNHDVVGAIHHAVMTDSLSGPVNIVGPSPVTNREFGRILARTLHRPYLFTIPAPVLRLIFGGVADAALLASMRAIPKRLEESGFEFDHNELAAGLRFLLP